MFVERSYYSSGSPPETQHQVHPELFGAPQLETPRFDPLPFSHTVSVLLEDIIHPEGDQKCPSSVDLSCNTEKYARIRDTTPEWDDGLEDDELFTGDFLETLFSRAPPRCEHACTRPHNVPSPWPEATNHGQDILTLSDFIFDPVSFRGGAGNCIRRSDGRSYAIRRVLQTRQAWAELAILELAKDARVAFSPLLYDAFEQDHYIYLIMEDYPSCTLTETIKRHGVFSSLEIFFYACEIITGLRSLHDAGIAHCNVSPDTIIFDKHGHTVLSGIERGTVIRPHQKCFHHSTASGSGKYYQAPELLLGWSHDTLVDSWSFGMVLCFMFHGKHPFLSLKNGEDDPNLCDFVNKILSDRIINSVVKFINPIARDLILKCVEHNPMMRLDARDIQNHPYFSNADWERIFRKAIQAPLRSRELFLSSPSVPAHDPIDPDRDSRRKCPSPFQSATTMPGGPARCFTQVWPQFLRTPGSRDKHAPTLVDLDHPLAQSTVMVEVTDRLDKMPGSHHVEESYFDATETIPDTSQKMSNFWDSLDHEERSSLHSGYSALSNMKVSFSSAWNLRKERSLVFPHRLFSLNATSIKQKLRRKAKSVTALKYAAYAEPIVDLPSGLSQIGSGIGFTCNVPAISPASVRNSMASDCTAVPKACHGLLYGIDMSGFWGGSKTTTTLGAGGSSVPVGEVTQESRAEEVLADHPAVALSPACIPRGQMEEKCGTFSGAGTPVLYTLSQPSKRSATTLPAIQELTSPTGSALTSSTEVEEEEALTPDTVAYQPGGGVVGMEQAIVEPKRSDEIYRLDPESTLRLVTPAAGLRLSWATEELCRF